jgi:hypothetical protein
VCTVHRYNYSEVIAADSSTSTVPRCGKHIYRLAVYQACSSLIAPHLSNNLCEEFATFVSSTVGCRLLSALSWPT